MNKTKCKQCNDVLLNGRKSFCNNKCRDHYNKKSRITIDCMVCDISFSVRKKEFNNRNIKYCSIKCRDVGRYNNTHIQYSCKICDKTFDRYSKNKKELCSWECQQKWNKIPENIKSRILKSMKSQKMKYNGKLYYQTDEFKKKSKLTKLDRYNDINYVNTEKAKQTKLNRYGDKNYINLKKMKETCLEKYGVDNFSKTKQFKDIHGKKVIKKLFNNIKFNEVITPLFDINDYTGVSGQYKFQCKKCNIIFTDTLNNGRIPRCINCYPIKNTSLAEKEVLHYIKSILPDTEIIENDKTILNGKELDIYIPSKKIAIEYNGLYWHSELHGNKDKNYHLNKTDECENRGIRLIQMFEDEWIYKRGIVKNRLKYILKLLNINIHARKCNISEISIKEKNAFLNEVHIQGEDKSKIKLGAFYENELVAVMTFSKKRIALGSKNINNDEYELSRFAVKYRITGIANRLLKYFIKNNNVKSIISYSDNRWNTGSLYKELGFDKISSGRPGYWYIKNGERIHRFNFRKDQLNNKLEKFDINLTEWQNMQLNGYDRIWDCGHNKYEMVL